MNKKYEAIFIIKNSDKENIEEIKRKINTIVKQEYCEIFHKEDIGLRRLAYDIKGEKEGYYYLLRFEVRQDAVNVIGDIETSINTIEEVMKYLVIRMEDK